MSGSRLFRVIVGVTAWFIACAANAQTARWEPDFRFPGTFFPAFAISASGKDSKGPTDAPQAYGYLGSGSFGIRVLEAPPGAKLKVRIEVPEIGVSGEIEAPALTDGKPKVIFPRLSWNQSRLVAIAQPIAAEVIFRFYVDGSLVGEERRPVRVRAINDTPLRSCRTPLQCTDYSPYMAGFVNENNPAIEGVLRAVLDVPTMPVKQWTGTQEGPDAALRQVWAIWYWLQRSKVTYSNIATVSDSRQDLFSQTVRPLSQTLQTAQANCIDGTVLFASILRKIGIDPVIVLVPGHAFLAFHTAPNGKPTFLETTMLNNANNPFYQRGPTKTGTDLARALGTDIHMQQSWNSFIAALGEGQRKYDQAAPNFGKQPGYMIIPILKAREAGIIPLPL